MRMRIPYFIVAICLGVVQSLFGQSLNQIQDLFPVRGEWAKTTLQKLTIDEKIAQLIMVPAYTGKNNSNFKEVETLIKEYKVGGVIFMQGGPVRQAEYANHFQKISDLPMLMAQDAEWGLSMRLDSCISFPKNMTLAAIQDDSLLFLYGALLAKQLKAVGVHVNFAPVIDVNNNPRNPVIGVRAFGDNKHNVTQKGLMLMQGMQKNGVIAVAKHFPGHGDTDKDSHYELPVINHSLQRLDTVELYPFKHLIDYGCMGVMVAHLMVPKLDPTPHLPSTLSPLIVQKLLKDKLNFQGLVFTDALNMGAVTKYFQNGEAELQAFLAGNDILLFSQNIPQAIQKIKTAIEQGKITEKDLDERVLKVLLAKEWLQLHQERLVNIQETYKILHERNAYVLASKLYKKSITLVKNEQRTIPIPHTNKKFAYIALGKNPNPKLLNALRVYTKIDDFKWEAFASPTLLQKQLESYDYVLFSVFNGAKNEFTDAELLKKIKTLQALKSKKIGMVVGSPYILEHFGQEEAILIAYENVEPCLTGLAEVVFGGLLPEGKLPIDIPQFRKRAWYFNTIQRLQFAEPEEVGLDFHTLAKIDTALQYYIQKEALPGAAVLIMKDNKIVYAKGTGYTEFDTLSPPADPLYAIYDLASVTKIVATTLCVMNLYENQQINLYAPIGRYLTELRDAPIGKCKIIELLQHTAGLPPFENFWTATLINGKSNPLMVSNQPSKEFNIPLTESIWVHHSFDSIFWQRLKNVKVAKKKEFVYSDLGMILLGKMIERVTGKSLYEYASLTFYEPMSMYNTFFQPYKQKLQAPFYIVPSEIDTYWRKQRIQGYVHDPNAAIMGGIAGHAGLFSNAFDLAKYAFMLLNNGEFANNCFLDATTIEYFTNAASSKYRRGLGFDKPEHNKNKVNPVCEQASLDTYGHLGFTGTALWIDPQYSIVYIFLSNRTFPNTKNPLFNQESVRIQIMSLIYRAMDNFKKNNAVAEGF